MTRKTNSSENDIRCHRLTGMSQNYFQNRNSNAKEMNKRKKTQILSKILRFSWQERIQKIKII